MYALPHSDNLTDVPEVRRHNRPVGGARAARLTPSRSMLRASYAELHRLADALIDARRAPRTIDPRALVNEAVRHTLGTSGLQDLADPDSYVAFLANSLRQLLEELVQQCIDRHCESPHLWLTPPGLPGGTDVATLLSAFRRLERRSPRHAQVAVLRMLGGLSDGEVAVQLGVTEARARGAWSRVRVWLSLTC